MNGATDPRPLIAHVVYRFAVGGLENGVVNLINRMPAERWRHAVVALTDVDPGFARRIQRNDVELIALHKPPGQGVWQYPALWRTFRALRPGIVHTRNLAALEAQVPSWVAGVRARVHGEHGRDMGDLDGTNRRHIWMRRAYRPFVQHYVALSQDLADYLSGPVGVEPVRIAQICNGVDAERFAPPSTPKPGAPARPPIPGCPFVGPDRWLVGTVGRMQAVKDQTLLARAFVRALALAPSLGDSLRLVMVGEGPLRAQAQAILSEAGLAHLAWMPGERSDVPDVMRGLDLFVLPSQAEGISNTILEAMACACPVLATRVGGNAELVDAGTTGELVPPGDVEAMAQALAALAADPVRAARMGQAGRARVEQHFSLQAMVGAYQDLYARLLCRR